jgi:hypothetical protein
MFPSKFVRGDGKKQAFERGGVVEALGYADLSHLP